MLNNRFSSQLLEKAVTEIGRLPGIGSKTALRLARICKKLLYKTHSNSATTSLS